MTREIKFRAWEQYPSDYAEEMGVKGQMHFGDAWGKNDDVQDKRTVVIAGFYHDSGWDMEDFIPMQFTGLSDKKGKEIFEGDIVTYKRGGAIRTREIDWDTARFGWSNLWLNPLDMEVIGNIYEHPELLKS